ncbi:hypothetical protein MKW92_019566 [Papaver armeniacum]|nr:hypothetical protein MKW92_019566 [Papaver armeniacum]
MFYRCFEAFHFWQISKPYPIDSANKSFHWTQVPCFRSVIAIGTYTQSISIQEVSSGIHVLSNAKQYGEKELPVKDMVEELMEDTAKADKSKLQRRCSRDWEYKLTLTVKTSSRVSFYEKYIENETWKEHTVSYQILAFGGIQVNKTNNTDKL